MSLDWLKHAFAIEKVDSFEPSDAQRSIVDRLCRHLVARKLATPALLFIETARPLNYLSAQLLEYFAPFLELAGGGEALGEFARFLEHRGSIDYLCRRIVTIEAEWLSDAGSNGPSAGDRTHPPQSASGEA